MAGQIRHGVMGVSGLFSFFRFRALAWAVALPLLVIAVCAGLSSAAQAEAPARFMQRVANQLIAAQRSGSASAFRQVLQTHGDLPSIGLYSLGSYRRKLPRSQRGSYYSGMISYIARAVMIESTNYPVLKAVVVGQTKETKAGVYVDSVVTLKSGSAYDVRWWLIRRGSTYKVGDAQVVGFWARDALKSQFENYIASNGGNPKRLVLALNGVR